MLRVRAGNRFAVSGRSGRNRGGQNRAAIAVHYIPARRLDRNEQYDEPDDRQGDSGIVPRDGAAGAVLHSRGADSAALLRHSRRGAFAGGRRRDSAAIKDNEGNVDNRAEECEHTILLSDYLKSLAEEDNKNNKLCLQGLTDDLFPDVRPDNGEYDNVNNTIGLCKFPCTVGSIREASDVYIDNPVISKLHACFSYGDKGFFVEDMNSTNGTYINGERLKVHTRVNINNGDILKFAAYEFKVSIV